MSYDSLVRTRQLYAPDLSGYIVQVLLQYLSTGQITGIASNTGSLTNVFYPLLANPSGYIDSLSGYATQIDVLANDNYVLSIVSGNYYLSNNPSGYLGTGGLTGYLPKSGAAYGGQDSFKIYDQSHSGAVFNYIPNNIYQLSGWNSGIISFQPFDNLGRPYISGFNLYSQNFNGQPALNSGQMSQMFASANYFSLSGGNLSLNYLKLYDPVYLGLFNFTTGTYLQQGYHSGHPSEQYLIDFYGNYASYFGVNTTRPYIYGFDIFGGVVQSSGYNVLTTQNLSGLINNTQFTGLSGYLIDQIQIGDNNLFNLITGISGQTSNYIVSGQGGVTTYITGNILVISGYSGAPFVADGTFVRTFGNQSITGQKTFYDTFDTLSLDTNSRIFSDTNGSSASNWGTRLLFDTNTRTSIDWQNRFLYDTGLLSFGNTAVIDWQKKHLLTGNQITLDWSGRILSGKWNVIGGLTVSGKPVTTGGPYVSPTQTGQFVVQGNTGQFITTAQTGLFYPFSNPAGYITSAQVSGSVAQVNGLSGVITISGISGITVYTGVPNTIFISGNFANSIPTGQFVTTGQTGAFVYTGITGNAFYPRFGNPAGFLTGNQVVNSITVTGYSISGNIILSGAGNISVGTGYTRQQIVISGDTGNLVFQGMTGQFITTAQTGLFYPASNPSGFITPTNQLSGTLVFRTLITGNANNQFINFPSFLDNNARVIATVHTTTDNLIVPFQVSGITGSGYWLMLADTIPDAGYSVDTIATISTQTGLATTVIINNNTTTGFVYTTSGSYAFRSSLLTGVTTQFISFPGILDTGARVVATLNNPSGNVIIPIQVSGITSSGYWLVSADVTNDINYSVDTIATISTASGLATTVVMVNNSINNTILSGSFTGVSGYSIGINQYFATGIPTGIDNSGILYPISYPSTPKSIQVSMEISTGSSFMYFVNISNRTASGFTAVFSDIIRENGVILHTWTNW